MTPAPVSVIKVGGSVLRDAAAYADVARAIFSEIARGPTWIVVSAGAGVTDRLERSLNAGSPSSELGELLDRHEAWNDGPFPAELREGLLARVSTGDPGALPRRLAWGERASAEVLKSRLGRSGRAVPIVELGSSSSLPPERNALVPGFYLREDDGGIRLLPRGGGDISAVLVAAALGSTSVRLWKRGGGIRIDGRALPRVLASDLLPRLEDPIRPIHVEAVRIAARLGIELSLEDPFGGAAATVIESGPGSRSWAYPTGVSPGVILDGIVAPSSGPITEPLAP